MLVITDRLAGHLVNDLGLDRKHLDRSTRVESEVRDYAVKMLTEGKLTADKLAELTKEEKSAAQQAVVKLVEETVAKSFAGFKDDILKAIAPNAGTDGASTPPAGTKAVQLPAGQAAGEPSAAEKAYAAGAAAAAGTGAGTADVQITHKSVLEQFDDTKRSLTYADSSNDFLRKSFGHRQLTVGESGGDIPARALHHPTERQKMVSGVWFKSMIAAGFREKGMPVPGAYRLTDGDRKLLEAVVHECKFVGPINQKSEDGEADFWCKGGRIPDHYRDAMVRKALLDDNPSGGLEAVPIEFDDSAIMTAVLEGELFPLVTQRTVTRRRIEGFSIGEPTLNWTAEGTAETVFTTDSFIAAFDTTIYAVVGAIEVGLDFEADSPAAIGDLLLERYGQAFRKEMDDVIADGDGTTQPKGLINTSGLGTVTTANGITGPHELGDYEGLLFGVAKQYRTEAGKARSIFLSNELSYRRSRSMVVDPAGTDERRLFGLAHEDYMTLSHPHKINESLANGEAGFFCMNRYRFYRRAGYGVRVVTEDATLALKNQRMIMVRARCGGQLELAAAGCETTTFQS